MKSKNLILFLISLIFSIVLSLNVSAQYYYTPTEITQDIVDFLNSAVGWLFGTTFLSVDILVYLAVTIILAIMFSDALITFSPLSKRASIAVGILLTAILLLLGFIQAVAYWLFVVTAVFGTFSMVASLFFVFVAYGIFHFAILRLLLKIWNPTGTNIAMVKIGIKGLQEIGEEFKKTKK